MFKRIFKFLCQYKYPLLLFFLTLIFYHKILLNPGQMLDSGDIDGIFSMEKWFFSTGVHNFHSIPLWNPYVFSGVPFLANPSAAVFYPVNILFLLINSDLAFGYIFILDVFLIGLFTYFFARKINLDKFSAFIAGIIFAFGAPVSVRIIPGHLFMLDTIVWFPLLLLFYEDILQKGKAVTGIFAGIVLSLMLLSGNAQATVYALVTASLYLFLSLLFKKGKNKTSAIKIIFLYFISLIIGFALSAVQLLPTMEFTKLSIRSQGLSYDFASNFSLHPLQMIASVFPYFFGSFNPILFWGKGNFHEDSLYSGIIPVILTFLAIITLIRKNKHAAIFSLILIFSLLYSFGKYTPVFYFFYKFVPFFNSFRVPARFLFVYSFSLSILSGFGLQYLLQNNKSKSFLNFLKTSVLTASITAFILLTVFSSKNGLKFYEAYILRNKYAVGINHIQLLNLFLRDLAVFSGSTISFFVILFFTKRQRIFKILMFLLIALDLFLFSYQFITTNNPEKIFETPSIIRKITQDHDRFRVFDLSGKLFTLFARNNIYTTTGIHSMQLKDYRDFFWQAGNHDNWPYESFFSFHDRISNTKVLDLLNVKYIISSSVLTNPGLEELYREPLNSLTPDGIKKITYYLYKNPGNLSHAYFVPDAIVKTDRKRLLQTLLSKDFNPKQTVMLEQNPGIPLKNNDEFKQISITTYQPDQIKLSADVSSHGFLVISELWYPGWKAYDNGKEVPLYRADYLLRSISLSKGKHNIEFVFKPLSLEIGKIISFITLLIIIIYFACYKKNLLPKSLK